MVNAWADYDSAINVHICRDGVPGISAAYENQVLLHGPNQRMLKAFSYRSLMVGMVLTSTIELYIWVTETGTCFKEIGV